MYKGTQDGRDYISRTGSHSTKPRRDLSGCSGFDHPELRQIERMALAEAEENQARLKEQFWIVRQHSPKSEERHRLELTLGHLKRRVAYLRQAADATDDYGTLIRAVKEVCGEAALIKVLERKALIQAELGELVGHPKSSGRPRKPVADRGGYTPEQKAQRAFKDGNQTPAA